MKLRFVTLTLAGVALVALAPGRVVAQDTATSRPDTIVFTPERGTVVFLHGRHSKDFECKSCHHESRPEKPLEKENQKCSSCHTAEPTGPVTTSLRNAMHDTEAREGTCYTCHNKASAEGKEAPTRCADCHKREGQPTAAARRPTNRLLAYLTR